MRKGEADIRVARREFAARPAYHDVICFECQQAAEKFLKALLQEHGLPIPKTHNLANLLAVLAPVDKSITALRRVGKSLSRFAIEYRYPGIRADRRKSRSALAAAERIRGEVRRRLGLRP